MADNTSESSVPVPLPRKSGSGGERIFRAVALSAGSTVVVAIALIAIFLLIRAVPSLQANNANFFTTATFSTGGTDGLAFGIRDLLVVTVLTSLLALAVAVPISISIAIFLTRYAPRQLSRPCGIVIDLLAAVPSIIFGLWGIFVLAPMLYPVTKFLNQHLGWVFLFAKGNVSLAGGGTIFTAGIVLAVMILPIITAVTREVLAQTPRGQVEAALALGATRWEVVKVVMLPFGRSGYISAAMLGLGRALGETVALLIILRATQTAFNWSLFDGGYTFATKIAATASEFNDQYKAGAYIAAGLVLFVLTLVVNALARAAITKKVH